MKTGNPHEGQRCGAKTRSGTTCQKAPGPNGRCHLHGGKTPIGHALPQTTHGRYSRYLPARLAERYQEALADGDLLSLQHEIALMGVRVVDLLAGMPVGDSTQRWRDLGAAWERVVAARAKRDTDAVGAALGEVEALITAGVADVDAWDEIGRVAEQRRRLTDSERKRQADMKLLITAERAMLLVSALFDIVRRHVVDPVALAAIAADIRELMERGS